MVEFIFTFNPVLVMHAVECLFFRSNIVDKIKNLEKGHVERNELIQNHLVLNDNDTRLNYKVDKKLTDYLTDVNFYKTCVLQCSLESTIRDYVFDDDTKHSCHELIRESGNDNWCSLDCADDMRVKSENFDKKHTNTLSAIHTNFDVYIECKKRKRLNMLGTEKYEKIKHRLHESNDKLLMRAYGYRLKKLKMDLQRLPISDASLIPVTLEGSTETKLENKNLPFANSFFN